MGNSDSNKKSPNEIHQQEPEVIELFRQNFGQEIDKLFAGCSNTFCHSASGDIYARGQNHWHSLGLTIKESENEEQGESYHTKYGSDASPTPKFVNITEKYPVLRNIKKIVPCFNRTFFLVYEQDQAKDPSPDYDRISGISVYTVGKNVEYELSVKFFLKHIVTDTIVSGALGSDSEKLIFQKNKELSRMRISQIAGGDEFTLYLTFSGKIYISGRLGSRKYTLFPRKISFNYEAPVVEISCGSYHSVLRTADNNVFSIGKNNSFQLGQESASSKTFRKTFVRIKFFKNNVVSVRCKADQSFFITTEAQVFACGRNEFGVLGVDSKDVQIQKLTDVKFIDDNKVERVYPSFNHTVFLTNSKHVFITGMINKCGSSLKFSLYPIRFPDIGAIKHIKAGRYHTVLVNTKNEIVFVEEKKVDLSVKTVHTISKITSENSFSNPNLRTCVPEVHERPRKQEEKAEKSEEQLQRSPHEVLFRKVFKQFVNVRSEHGVEETRSIRTLFKIFEETRSLYPKENTLFLREELLLLNFANDRTQKHSNEILEICKKLHRDDDKKFVKENPLFAFDSLLIQYYVRLEKIRNKFDLEFLSRGETRITNIDDRRWKTLYEKANETVKLPNETIRRYHSWVKNIIQFMKIVNSSDSSDVQFTPLKKFDNLPFVMELLGEIVTFCKSLVQSHVVELDIIHVPRKPRKLTGKSRVSPGLTRNVTWDIKFFETKFLDVKNVKIKRGGQGICLLLDPKSYSTPDRDDLDDFQGKTKYVIKKANYGSLKKLNEVQEKLFSEYHPNILSPLKYKNINSLRYEIFPYFNFDGGGFLEFLRVFPKHKRTLLAYRYLEEVGEALKFLHTGEYQSDKFIYVDLKPNNTLVRWISELSQGRIEVVLTDFGTLHQHDTDEPMKTTIGGSYYLAPEARNDSVQETDYDHRVDVYSYGVLVKEVLFEWFQLKEQDVSPNPFEGELRDEIKKMMEKDVNHRRNDVNYMLELLRKSRKLFEEKTPSFVVVVGDLCVVEGGSKLKSLNIFKKFDFYEVDELRTKILNIVDLLKFDVENVTIKNYGDEENEYWNLKGCDPEKKFSVLKVFDVKITKKVENQKRFEISPIAKCVQDGELTKLMKNYSKETVLSEKLYSNEFEMHIDMIMAAMIIGSTSEKAPKYPVLEWLLSSAKKK